MVRIHFPPAASHANFRSRARYIGHDPDRARELQSNSWNRSCRSSKPNCRLPPKARKPQLALRNGGRGVNDCLMAVGYVTAVERRRQAEMRGAGLRWAPARKRSGPRKRGFGTHKRISGRSMSDHLAALRRYHSAVADAL